ncbi:6PF2K-domain-containing protein [Serendipita vermifera]|nr:6PF2K-domain-containing protein [Serendipita vermifera]
MAAPLYTTSSGLLWHAGKILIVVAGLPARGKTHISRSLERYLRWNGVTTEVYSLGDYRRKLLGHARDLPEDYFTYGPKSPETTDLRNSVRERCERDILDFFDHAGQVAIYDANNGTKESRMKLYNKFHCLGYHVIFLESVCTNQDIVLANIRSVKISSPDYANWDQDKAVEDYMRRIADHERHYEPVEETEVPWIRLVNVGEKVQINKIQGYLQSRIVFFLMNIHNRHRFIYFARSGQSLIEHSYRADSDLSPSGWDYARRLKNFMLERRFLNIEERRQSGSGTGEERNLVIWTSSRRRSHHTAWPFIKDNGDTVSGDGITPLRTPGDLDDAIPLPHESGLTFPGPTLSPSASNPPLPNTGTPIITPNKLAYSKIKVVEKSRLCEINPGVWDGLSPDDVQSRYPSEWEDFLRDPYGHRAPRAESYHDLCIRLEPIIIEMEDVKDDLLIISHASVIRCLLAYLVGLPAHEIPAVDIARGDLIEVQPSAYGVKTRMFHFWSGPGRKDSEAARSGLDAEMSSMRDGTSTNGSVVGDVKVDEASSSPVHSTSERASPPRSNLHLERRYRSRTSSIVDLPENRDLSMTPIDLGREPKAGNGADVKDSEVPRKKREATSQKEKLLEKTKTLTTDPQPIPTVANLAKQTTEAVEESPTEASKVLPKVETSLGADEAGQVAAKIEAADTRPTFYENVVEVATKRKKTGGTVTSSPYMTNATINTATVANLAATSPPQRQQSGIEKP